jgi:uncharacterized protein YndB with AHSA1/START domain
MANILHDLPIAAPPEEVFRAISTPDGLNEWWTQTSRGTPSLGSDYSLGFGPEYLWHARVTELTAARAFELEMTAADSDWKGTRVGFRLTPRDGGGTLVAFRHTGWPSVNAHFRTSNCCWAMYLRILRRYLEHGERVPYEKRLDV